MSDERPHRSLAERISVHDDRVEHRHEEEELTEAAERAGVDLDPTSVTRPRGKPRSATTWTAT